MLLSPLGLRRSRFSLSVLVAIVTLAGVLFAWLGIWERNARTRRHALEAIRAKGGTVTWDVQSTSYQHSLFAPKWLVDKVGYEYFGEFVSIAIPFATDADLTLLNAFDKVQSLQLKECRISDSGLHKICMLRWLDNLLLDSPFVSDSGIQELENLTELESLLIGALGDGVTSLNRIGKLRKLKGLVVEDSEFSDAMLLELRDAKQLITIQLHGTAVTKSGATELAKHLPGCFIAAGPIAVHTCLNPGSQTQTWLFSISPDRDVNGKPSVPTKRGE